ncbi:DUF5360 family protein [Streptomyces sp. NPDC032161]|uniref:DUF5360 family protein n=1 Tax=unclassified Streptomyces TaxID=2593676 RepID=UPI0033ECC75B
MAEPRLDRLLRATTVAMVLTDVGFVVYWALVIIGALPPEAMFDEYTDPRVTAWNWSFLPLDIAASISGLAAVRAMRRGSHAAPAALTLSLALTATAGGMAVAYFTLRGQLDPSWLLPNLALLLFPLPLLTRLTCTGRPTLIDAGSY